MNPALSFILLLIAFLGVWALVNCVLKWTMDFDNSIGKAVNYRNGPSERMTRIAIALTKTGLININRRGVLDYTPLQWALACISLSYGNKLREGADPAKQERIIANLLAHGADPCKIYSDGRTTIQKFQDEVAQSWSKIPKPQAERLIAMMQAATGGSCPVGGRK